MGIFSKRSVIAIAVGVVFSMIMFILVSKSPYIFAAGLAIAAFLAQLSTFKSGVIHGLITALPLSLYIVFSDSWSGGSGLLYIWLNIILLVAFGGIYCGAIVWLINRLKQGKIFFS